MLKKITLSVVVVVAVLVFGLVKTKRVFLENTNEHYYNGYSYIENTEYFCALRVYEDPDLQGLHYSYLSNITIEFKGKVDYVDAYTIQGSYILRGPHNEIYNGTIEIDKRKGGIICLN